MKSAPPPSRPPAAAPAGPPLARRHALATWFLALSCLIGSANSGLAQSDDPPAAPPPGTEEPAPAVAPDAGPQAEPWPAAPEPDAAPGQPVPPTEPEADADPEEPAEADPAPAGEDSQAVAPAPILRPDPPDSGRPPILPRRPAAPAAAGTAAATEATPGPATTGDTNSIRLNFRNAPLEMVLNYLSEAAGFVIVVETEVRGRIDVWSNQPLNQDEALELLNKVLARNGYAAIRDGRMLTIVSRDDAKKRDIPVRAGSDPTDIPRGEAIVTQILPVRFVSATQLSRDLLPLFPSSATIAANEGGNALVITDTLTNIRRIAQIVRALDTSIAAVSTVRVFPLQYADSKALATVVRDLFAGTDTSRGGNQQQQIFRGFRGGGPPGFGGDAGGGGGSTGSGRVATPKVVAVADERSNALVVSAPEDQMLLIADLVEQVDVNVDDVTELRVFRLRFSDPQEMSELITELFPDPTSSQNQGRGQVRFGGFGGPGGFAGRQAGADQSSRLQKQSRVLAVPDIRTQSVVVSAARELMDQIEAMVLQLDSDDAKKQKVYTFSVENTDPAAVEEILRGLFETQNTRNRSTTRNNNRQPGSQLNNRATSNMQNQGRNTGGFGGTGGTRGFGNNSP